MVRMIREYETHLILILLVFLSLGLLTFTAYVGSLGLWNGACHLCGRLAAVGGAFAGLPVVAEGLATPPTNLGP
jgi:hypothetical protein